MQDKTEDLVAHVDGTQEEARTLAAYGEGVALSSLKEESIPPMITQADRDKFEREQRSGWYESRS